MRGQSLLAVQRLVAPFRKNPDGAGDVSSYTSQVSSWIFLEFSLSMLRPPRQETPLEFFSCRGETDTKFRKHILFWINVVNASMCGRSTIMGSLLRLAKSQTGAPYWTYQSGPENNLKLHGVTIAVNSRAHSVLTSRKLVFPRFAVARFRSIPFNVALLAPA